MKQILVISGKGGTGKTVLTAAFACCAQHKVMVDCDVDAADLHLLLHPHVQERHAFHGLPKATIDQETCTGCGECLPVCRYHAIAHVTSRKTNIEDNHNNTSYVVNPISCEGCKTCMYVCPVDAIRMIDNTAGEWFISETKYGPLVHAKLGIAEENSGKLVSVVRQNSKRIAEEKSMDYIIIDGPPGIGCPVIASLSGVNTAVVVVEPTLSGIHDMARVVAVAKHFNVRATCVINKFDININNTMAIEDWCTENHVRVLGRIPFDQSVIESIVQGVPLIEYTNNQVTEKIKEIWQHLDTL
jgi:MinD superfamily P-loop ATPase